MSYSRYSRKKDLKDKHKIANLHDRKSKKKSSEFEKENANYIPAPLLKQLNLILNDKKLSASFKLLAIYCAISLTCGPVVARLFFSQFLMVNGLEISLTNNHPDEDAREHADTFSAAGNNTNDSSPATTQTVSTHTQQVPSSTPPEATTLSSSSQIHNQGEFTQSTQKRKNNHTSKKQTSENSMTVENKNKLALKNYIERALKDILSFKKEYYLDKLFDEQRKMYFIENVYAPFEKYCKEIVKKQLENINTEFDKIRKTEQDLHDLSQKFVRNSLEALFESEAMLLKDMLNNPMLSYKNHFLKNREKFESSLHTSWTELEKNSLSSELYKKLFENKYEEENFTKFLRELDDEWTTETAKLIYASDKWMENVNYPSTDNKSDNQLSKKNKDYAQLKDELGKSHKNLMVLCKMATLEFLNNEFIQYKSFNFNGKVINILFSAIIKNETQKLENDFFIKFKKIAPSKHLLPTDIVDFKDSSGQIYQAEKEFENFLNDLKENTKKFITDSKNYYSKKLIHTEQVNFFEPNFITFSETINTIIEDCIKDGSVRLTRIKNSYSLTQQREKIILLPAAIQSKYQTSMAQHHDVFFKQMCEHTQIGCTKTKFYSSIVLFQETLDRNWTSSEKNNMLKQPIIPTGLFLGDDTSYVNELIKHLRGKYKFSDNEINEFFTQGEKKIDQAKEKLIDKTIPSYNQFIGNMNTQFDALKRKFNHQVDNLYFSMSHGCKQFYSEESKRLPIRCTIEMINALFGSSITNKKSQLQAQFSQELDQLISNEITVYKTFLLRQEMENQNVLIQIIKNIWAACLDNPYLFALPVLVLILTYRMITYGKNTRVISETKPSTKSATSNKLKTLPAPNAHDPAQSIEPIILDQPSRDQRRISEIKKSIKDWQDKYEQYKKQLDFTISKISSVKKLATSTENHDKADEAQNLCNKFSNNDLKGRNEKLTDVYHNKDVDLKMFENHLELLKNPDINELNTATDHLTNKCTQLDKIISHSNRSSISSDKKKTIIENIKHKKNKKEEDKKLQIAFEKKKAEQEQKKLPNPTVNPNRVASKTNNTNNNRNNHPYNNIRKTTAANTPIQQTNVQPQSVKVAASVTHINTNTTTTSSNTTSDLSGQQLTFIPAKQQPKPIHTASKNGNNNNNNAPIPFSANQMTLHSYKQNARKNKITDETLLNKLFEKYKLVFALNDDSEDSKTNKYSFLLAFVKLCNHILHSKKYKNLPDNDPEKLKIEKFRALICHYSPAVPFDTLINLTTDLKNLYDDEEEKTLDRMLLTVIDTVFETDKEEINLLSTLPKKSTFEHTVTPNHLIDDLTSFCTIYLKVNKACGDQNLTRYMHDHHLLEYQACEFLLLTIEKKLDILNLIPQSFDRDELRKFRNYFAHTSEYIHPDAMAQALNILAKMLDNLKDAQLKTDDVNKFIDCYPKSVRNFSL